MQADINCIYTISLSLSLPLFLTAIILPQLSSIAPKIGLIDYPNKRKIHNTPKPLVGGIAMFLSIIICYLFFISSSEFNGFLAGLILLAAIGFLDDYKELNHRWKFLAQILATIIIMSVSKTYLLSFGDLLNTSPINLGIFTIPATIFCVVGVINAINMIDGLDGLAGGVALIAFLAFSVFSYLNGYQEMFFLSLVISGAITGFLIYNWHPAKLFMGDTGSLILGFSLAFFSIELTQESNTKIPPVVPLVVLALPITDTVVVMIKRAMMRKSPFYADKNHFHHILLKMGFPKKTTVKIILSISSIFALIGISGVLFQIEEHILFMIFLLFFFLYFLSSFYIKTIFRMKLKLLKCFKIAQKSLHRL